MTLIKSISGFRGTIGGTVGEALTPIDIALLAAGYGTWLKNNRMQPKVIIGRDGRVTGPLVQSIVTQVLIMQGIDVVDAGLTTTPTVEMGVKFLDADGGIIITASHNPMNWNALKLLNQDGEFLDKEDGEAVLGFSENLNELQFSPIEELGLYQAGGNLLEQHIDAILALPYIKSEEIRQANLSVVVDPINSSGGIAIKVLLDRLSVKSTFINDEVKGKFAHNPEPLAKHLTQLSEVVVSNKADMGIAVDPDVDRLALMCEDGELFGEENTLVAVSDYILETKPGATVSNLSSTRGLRDITIRHGHEYFPSAVGEVNVVAEMKKRNAVIGGEGNGGVILPDLHYGRDALAGIALFLSYYVEKQSLMSEIKSSLPQYHMSKEKVTLEGDIDPQHCLDGIHDKFKNHPGLNTIDGVKIDFESSWIHMRKSNTEPIIRIYAEALSLDEANKLTASFINQILNKL